MPNLFSCQISSSGTSQVVGLWPLAKPKNHNAHPPQRILNRRYSKTSVILPTTEGQQPTTVFLQPNVRRQATFVNRDTESVVALTPNIKLVVRPSSLANRFGRRPTTYDQRRVSGGADRDRTGGLLVANQALSQLSYSPTIMVGLGRLELPTSSLSGMRSSHLSYRPGYSIRSGALIHLRLSAISLQLSARFD